ncbi:fructose-1-phosphate/6-phosphogluconate phosphatase [Enterovibrio paralichthyis]|uniref:fructose-1-phosphate/6-phosphogluconate phosphatase n=1 Tax=Enterovibrio paralichthyis TaxID=2853805 RepID=UPI001C44B47D|nr:fructose-1-phosphate/6-phosphogluconate phosphatase [Enterovibrio paralichthyis]MBV7297747.1 fructose-1-phosphate/6-phosphogluconate phosphatase [Enterovibrio paralichthyis]
MCRYDKYEAFIFDLDGTLIDSMPGHYAAWLQTAADFGFDVDEAWYHTRGGSPTLLTAKSLVEEKDLDIDPAVLAAHKTQQFKAIMEDHLEILPFAEVARHFAGKKPIAVGTGTLTDIAERMLEKTGLLPLMDVVVGADQVSAHKPEPDTFLRCAERLNVAPEKCLVFEDAVFGINAAKAAGMDVIDVRVTDIGLD